MKTQAVKLKSGLYIHVQFTNRTEHGINLWKFWVIRDKYLKTAREAVRKILQMDGWKDENTLNARP